VFPLLSALPSLSSLSLADQILQSGMWVYLLVFLVILLASTIVGGPIPDNTFLLLTGAVASGDGLSMELLLIVAMAGGFAGYEINYWSGRLFLKHRMQKEMPKSS
jgi:membrane protein DedA with SNARE-associated domain